MSVATKFYGELIAEEMFSDKVTFGIDDIYLRHKWIKADCWAASKLYTNMDQMRLDKGFGFYSQRFNGDKALSASTGYNKRFALTISAFLGDDEMNEGLGRTFYWLTVNCKGCTLSNSVIRPTPNGPIESHQLKFESVTISQHVPEVYVDRPGGYAPKRSKWDTGGSIF